MSWPEPRTVPAGPGGMPGSRSAGLATPVQPVDATIFRQSSISLPPATETNISGKFLAFPGISYGLLFNILTPSAPTVPFLKASIQWENAAPDVIDTDHWFVSCTDVSPAAGNMQFSGRGPTTAGRMQFLLQNFDPAVTMSAQVLQYSSSRVVTRHDIRNLSNNIATTFTYQTITFSTPISEPTALLLGSSPGITIPAGQIAYRMMGLFSGSAMLSVQAGTGVTIPVKLFAAPPTFAVPFTTIYSARTDANGNIPGAIVTLPRIQTILSLDNSSGSTSIGVSYSLTGLESST